MANVFITGAGGGFGLLTVQQLIRDGHKVVGTVRDMSGRNKAKTMDLEKLGTKVVEMDVTDEASVDSAIKKARELMGSVDVLINNAGLGVLGLTEAFTTADVKKVFDVNVFGVHRVMRAVLPDMRKRSKGLVINVSSLLGRMTVPFYGPYNATKWALEGLTENYRTEVSQFGVEVCIVEPGGYPTTFMDNLVRASDKERAKEYGPMADMAEGFLKGFEQALASNPAQDPNHVAQAIGKLISSSHGARPFRTIVDNMGMGSHLSEYNAHLGQITEAIYKNFGIAHLLKVKS